MRHQGRISKWKDEQGFGFITPNAGGREVFVHIRSFANAQRRPAGNELVTYTLRIDTKGRPSAEGVAYLGERPAPVASRPGNAPLLVAAAFLAFIAAAVVTGRLPPVVLALYLVASAVAYVAYALDKAAARKGNRRTPEDTLHLYALAGGWPGALAAQHILRHKSRKRSFQVVFWVTVALNCGVLGWLLTASGTQALRALLAMAIA